MDRDPQTAAELYELVNQWPKGARPTCVTGWIRGAWVEVRAAEQTDKAHCVHAYMFPEDAIDLHIASGLRWLADEFQCRIEIKAPCVDHDDWFVANVSSFGIHHAPTLFLALHAAILAASKGDSQ